MTGIYDPVVPKHTIPAVWGADLLSLLTVPVLIVSLCLVTRGSLRGLITLAGILGYVAYAYFGHIFTYIQDLTVPWGLAGLFLTLTTISIALTIVYFKNLQKPVDVVYITR